MGRRQVGFRELTERTDPKVVREVIGAHFRRLTSRAGVNLAQFKAQILEEDMVQILGDFAMDVTGYVPPALRRQCAIDVLTIARGAPKPWLHDGQTIEPDATGQSGRTVADEIESARRSAEALKDLDGYVRRKVHPSQWPEHVRLAAGDSLAFFEETMEAEETAVSPTG